PDLVLVVGVGRITGCVRWRRHVLIVAAGLHVIAGQLVDVRPEGAVRGQAGHLQHHARLAATGVERLDGATDHRDRVLHAVAVGVGVDDPRAHRHGDYPAVSDRAAAVGHRAIGAGVGHGAIGGRAVGHS